MKLVSLSCVLLVLAFAPVFPACAAKKKEKEKDAHFRPHIQPTPTKSDFLSGSQVSSRLNEKSPPGVIIIPLERFPAVNPNVPKPTPGSGTAPSKQPTTSATNNT